MKNNDNIQIFFLKKSGMQGMKKLPKNSFSNSYDVEFANPRFI